MVRFAFGQRCPTMCKAEPARGEGTRTSTFTKVTVEPLPGMVRPGFVVHGLEIIDERVQRRMLGEGWQWSWRRTKLARRLNGHVWGLHVSAVVAEVAHTGIVQHQRTAEGTVFQQPNPSVEGDFMMLCRRQEWNVLVAEHTSAPLHEVDDNLDQQGLMPARHLIIHNEPGVQAPEVVQVVHACLKQVVQFQLQGMRCWCQFGWCEAPPSIEVVEMAHQVLKPRRPPGEDAFHTREEVDFVILHGDVGVWGVHALHSTSLPLTVRFAYAIRLNIGIAEHRIP